MISVQPEGLQESSRWSEGSGDHRYRVNWNTPLKGCWIFPTKVLHPIGCYPRPPHVSGGLRYASTTGYLLAALRAGLSAKSIKLMLPQKGEEENLWL